MAQPDGAVRPLLTIGIKALNEEAHIADAIASALAVAQPLGGEVILADSGSSDRTIEIARRFPIRIVQLANHAERRCGAGAQLAFQHARGEYFYLLDGDMELEADFVTAALEFLAGHPGHAAVGGHLREINTANAEFRIRQVKVQEGKDRQPGDVDRLEGGGLYRTEAIREVGYFADRNLHAFEEFDLAARLTVKGWKLARIDRLAVRHYGHTTESYRLLIRRIRSGYTGGTGEILRAAIGRPHLPLILRRLGHIRNGVGVIGWWILLAAMLVWKLPWWLIAPYALAPLALLCWRRKSPELAFYSFLKWNSTALGLVSGLMRPRVSPEMPLRSIDVA